MIYPNQRFIKINKETVSQSKITGRKYLIAYQDNIMNACNDLSSSAFKVYMALMLNKDGYVFDYSPECLRQMTNLCRATAKKALLELEEKHYLIKEDDKQFNFYEFPYRKIPGVIV